MATRFDAVPHTQHGKVLRDQDGVHDHGVSGRTCGVYELQLGRVREHGFGDERLAPFDEFGPGFGGDTCGLVGMRGWVVAPAALGNLVSTDDETSRKQVCGRRGVGPDLPRVQRRSDSHEGMSDTET
jgi:hypothetical protein